VIYVNYGLLAKFLV